VFSAGVQDVTKPEPTAPVTPNATAPDKKSRREKLLFLIF
jgi:hypothetical protein